MLITGKAFRLLCKTLEMGCWCKLYPYSFDKDKKRLALIKKRYQMWIHKVHKYIMYIITVLSFLRLIQALSHPHFPLLLKILNIAWVAVYFLCCIGFHQFETNGYEVMQFVNCLLQRMDCPSRSRIDPVNGNICYCQFF
jgi:hypothetical protein